MGWGGLKCICQTISILFIEVIIAIKYRAGRGDTVSIKSLLNGLINPILFI